MRRGGRQEKTSKLVRTKEAGFAGVRVGRKRKQETSVHGGLASTLVFLGRTRQLGSAGKSDNALEGSPGC